MVGGIRPILYSVAHASTAISGARNHWSLVWLELQEEKYQLNHLFTEQGLREQPREQLKR